ncbi:MAG: amidohydrolase family protein [Reyranella sp.]|uniref:amidohydrolase family protein n=1 Tax=Reyranella sp. TaxID=1929291 RepID=UPI003D10A6B4
MSILIRQASIIAMDKQHGSTPFVGDILVEADRIRAIGPDLGPPVADTVIDGRDRLVMPGLVNGHLHSGEALFKGRYDNMPLELWMLYCYPILGGQPPGDRLIYLRSMVVAMESLKNGVTTVVDDVYELGGQSMDQLAQVFQAYDDAGMRANVSGHIMDRPFLDTIPFAHEMLPADLRAKAGALATPGMGDYLDFCRSAAARFNDRSGRLRFMIAPSAPQRCTEPLMLAADALARSIGSPFHTHILETKTQAVTGPEFHGKTLIRYMHDLGLLHSGTTIAHSIWVTDDDIALMGDAGCSIVHNVISNQKLGAGIAPMRKLLDAGVNVALGSDGICSNDTPRMFDVMHAAGLLHSVSSPDYDTWVAASEVLECATIKGAKSALLGHETGSLEAGKKADLVILDLNTAPFTPLNDLRNHLVYCENGSSIESVMVNGEIVVEDGKLVRVNEGELLAELREAWAAYRPAHAATEAENAVFHPYFAAIHKRCTSMDVGINRYGSDMPAWKGHNRRAS